MLAVVLACWSVGAFAQIAFRASSSAFNAGMGVQNNAVWNAASANAGATVEPPLPATRNVGDLLLTIIEARHLNAVSMPSPAWTLLGSGTQNPGHQAAIYWRIADNTAADRAIVNRGGGSDVVLARVAAFANVDTANPFDGFSFGSSGGATNTVATGAITTTNACSTLVVTMHIADDNTITTPAGWNTLSPTSFYSSTTTGSDAAIGMFVRAAPGVGVQPSVTVTHSANDFSHAAQIALRPAGLTLNVPAGTQAGDVMVATLATRPANSTSTNNNAKTVCAPPGWTLVRDTTNNLGGGSGGTGVRLQTYYRVATAAEPASYTWYAVLNNPSLPLGTGAGQYFVSGAGGIVSYSGVDGASPVNVEGGNTVDVKTFDHTGNSITTTVANTMLVTSHTFASADFWTAPAGMTGRVDQSAPPTNNAVGIALKMSDEPRPTAGATGNKMARASGTGGSNADEGAVHLLALRPGPLVAHYAISVAAATVPNCDYAEVTIVGHNASHAATNVPVGRTVTLTTSTGTGVWQAGLVAGTGTWLPSGLNNGTASYAWPGGESGFTVRLRQSAVTSLSVNLNDGFITEDATEDPTISFVNSAFRISNGSNAPLSIGTQIAGKASNVAPGAQNLFLQAIRTDTATGACVSLFPNGSDVSIQVGAQCNNPATCTQNVTLTSSSPASNTASFVPNGAYPASMNFRFTTANAEAPFNLSYADAGQITLQFRAALPSPPANQFVQGTSNAFVVRPFGFAFTGITHATLATSPVLAAAGDNFSMTLGAYRWSAADDANNDGIPDSGANLTDNGLTPNFAAGTTVSATGNLPGVATGTVDRASGGSSIAAGEWSGGLASIANWRYSEVGNVFLSATSNNYLGSGANVTGNSGHDGTGAAGGYVGRFRPKHFAVSATGLANRYALGCGGSFSYMNEGLRLNLTLTAQNAQNGTTQNYNGAYAKLGLTTFSNWSLGARSGTTNLIPRVDGAIAPVGSWSNGSAAVTIDTAIRRQLALDDPDGPYPGLQFGIAPVDSDGVAMNTLDFDADNNSVNERKNLGVSTEVRFGRLRVENAVGAESLPLPIRMETQHWNGTSFVRNTSDNCSTVSRQNFSLGGYTGNLNACETMVNEAAVTFSSGLATVSLAAPGSANAGTVLVGLNLGAASGSRCDAIGAAGPAATSAAMSYLLGRWNDGANPDGDPNTNYDDNPAARAAFGLYGGQPNNFIYFRENY